MVSMAGARGDPPGATPGLRILVVEDNPADADLVREALQGTPGLELLHVERIASAQAALARGGIDVILLDLSLPDALGLEGLQAIRAAAPAIPVVVLTSLAEESTGTRAVQEGAQDYLLKGQADGPLLTRAVRYALERQLYSRRAQQLAEERAARTAIEEEHQRALLLSQVGTALGASLDVETTLAEAARHLVAQVADVCVVAVLDTQRAAGEQLVVVHAHAAGVQVLRHAAAGGDKGLALLGGNKPELHPALAPGGLQRLFEGTGVEVGGAEGASWSVMRVPMQARGHALGALCLGAREAARRYGPRDLVLARALAERFGSAIENALLYRRAQEAVAARDEFLAVAAHELRTPVTALQLQLGSQQRTMRSLAQRPGADCSTCSGSFQRATRQTERLTQLIESLLDVTRITSGNLQLEPEALDLVELTRAVLERSHEQALLARCPLSLDAGAPVRGCWDRDTLEHAIGNLVMNALKYGAGHPVEVTVRSEGESAVLCVRDHGIGISPEDVERIFGRFERAVSTRHYGGLGLGLFIVRQVVEAHHGSIVAWSEPGGGSSFTLRLPRAG